MHLPKSGLFSTPLHSSYEADFITQCLFLPVPKRRFLPRYSCRILRLSFSLSSSLSERARHGFSDRRLVMKPPRLIANELADQAIVPSADFLRTIAIDLLDQRPIPSRIKDSQHGKGGTPQAKAPPLNLSVCLRELRRTNARSHPARYRRRDIAQFVGSPDPGGGRRLRNSVPWTRGRLRQADAPSRVG